MAWQTLRVTIKGEDPVVVETSARDWAAIPIDSGGMTMGVMFRLAHNAMLRTGHSVPRDFDGFLDALAGNVETVDDDSPDLMDPTHPARSDA